ncbi:sensor histidine kinase [Sphingomonas morindae]|uniref:histidine kinase n=1 Tax=Sphingomonas morindae TaxID=1541170 RepID=A0ABY4XD44_9SPHN|nr:HAMP domain-containing sensor histidine kinase [Sphingomonas morindae]USI74835.1 HAMP domain-containing histidine kinase [Sphingomonas morindae]
MRLLPRSLAGRLLATAALALLVALAIAAAAIGHVLGRFVIAGMDQRLDAQLALVARAVGPDGSVAPGRLIDPPPFDRPGSGWAWQLRAPGGRWHSASAAGMGPVRATGPSHNPPPPPHPERGPAAPPPQESGLPGPPPRPFDGIAADGAPIHGRLLEIATTRGPAVLLATAPRALVRRPLREATAPLLLSVALLGGLLLLAVLVQLRLGLRPLARLGTMLAEVRAGRRRHVEVEEPTELLPLVAELNALIDANEAGLAAARRHVANLAHGLKTPLATLRLDLAEPGRDPDGRLAAQVARLEAQIRHHLARARAAEPGAAATPRIPLRQALDALVAALARIHADRGVAARLAVPDALAVRCDPQDLDEALGNLLDNGWRHARRLVRCSAEPDGRQIALRIEDDGDTLDEAGLAALQAGEARLDEQGAGYGQGIRIARALIELHGGTLRFARGASGGLAVTLTLPAASDAPR